MPRLFINLSRLVGTFRQAAPSVAVVISFILGALFSCGAAAEEPDDIGPHHVLITYHAEPRNRPAFRSFLASEGRVPFDRLVRDGTLTGYQVLFNPFVSADTWDAMVVLAFRHYADTARWKEIERVSPGGLSARGLKLARPVDTYSADLPWLGSSPSASTRDSVFYVIPYEYRTAEEYRKYVQAYVLPQVEGWMREGVLTGYRIYMNRYPVGPPWDSLFIFQYRDLAAFGRREEVVAKVRQGLKNDPDWQKLNETKQTIRTESENTIAETVEPSPADAPTGNRRVSPPRSRLIPAPAQK